MPKASKFSPDEGLTIYDLKDSEAVHYGEQAKGYVGKNRFKTQNMPYSNTAGIILSRDTDNSITLNGTSTREWYFPNTEDVGYNYYDVIPGNSYIFSTGVINSDLQLQVFTKATSSSSWVELAETSSGTDCIFTVPNNYYTLWIRIRSVANKTYDSVKLYPMLRDISISDNTYEPYLPKNDEIIQQWEKQSKGYVGKNLFNEIYENLGIWGNNQEGFDIHDATNGVTVGRIIKKNTNYTVTRQGGNRFRIVLWETKPTIPSYTYSPGIEVVFDDSLTEYTFNSGNYEYCALYCNGTDPYVLDDIKAMLRLSSISDSTYEPYLYSNEELYENSLCYKGDIPASSDLNNYKSMGLYGILATSPSNEPSEMLGRTYALMVIKFGNWVKQIIIRGNSVAAFYMRSFDGSNWESWVKVTSTSI